MNKIKSIVYWQVGWTIHGQKEFQHLLCYAECCWVGWSKLIILPFPLRTFFLQCQDQWMMRSKVIVQGFCLWGGPRGFGFNHNLLLHCKKCLSKVFLDETWAWQETHKKKKKRNCAASCTFNREQRKKVRQGSADNTAFNFVSLQSMHNTWSVHAINPWLFCSIPTPDTGWGSIPVLKCPFSCQNVPW